MADAGQRRRSVPGMRCTWLNSRSFPCTRESMRLSFQKKIGISRRRNGKSMLIGVRRSTILPMRIFCPAF